MTCKRFVGIASSIGAAVPVAWLFMYQFVGRVFPSLQDFLSDLPGIDYALLILWPSSLLLIADPTNSNPGPWLQSAVANAVLYAIVGWALWLGIYRLRLLLVALVLLLIGLWTFLLAL